MDQNKTLKAGDLVKYHVQDETLTELGFKLGQIYMVKTTLKGALAADNGDAYAVLVMDGALTDHADHFAKHRCPVVLPRGVQ
jgi:hypothetical protein